MFLLVQDINDMTYHLLVAGGSYNLFDNSMVTVSRGFKPINFICGLLNRSGENKSILVYYTDGHEGWKFDHIDGVKKGEKFTGFTL